MLLKKVSCLPPFAKMAAIRSEWMPVVVCRGKMTLTVSLLIFLLVGLPQKGYSTTPAADSKSPSAQECRQHIEKALDQYFDSSQGDQATKHDDTVTQTQIAESDKENGKDDDDDEDDELPASEKSRTEDSDEDDNDNSKNENEDENNDDDNNDSIERKDFKKETENQIEDEDENDEDEEDEDDEDDEPESIGDDQPAKLDANLVDDEDEDDDENEDVDEDEDQVEENENNNMDDNDNEDEDNDILTQDNITKINEFQGAGSSENYRSKISSEKNKEGEEKEENHDDEITDEDDEDEAEEEEEGAEDDDEDAEEEDVKYDNDDEEEEESAEDDEEKDTEGEKDDERSDDEVAEKDEELVNDDKESDTESVKTQESPEAETVAHQLSQEKTSEEISKKEQDSQKATGGADSATVRVAQELPGSEPSTEQPKAQEVSEETQTVTTPPEEGTNETELKNRTVLISENEDNDEDDDEEGDEKEDEDEDDDLIENIYEDDDDDADSSPGSFFRNRDHVDAILNVDDMGYELEEEKLAMSIFKDIKKIHAASIKPMEMLYKFTDSTSRLLGDAEIFNKPMILFLGPWSTGKTSILNYLLGIERTPVALKTASGITDVDFTVITYGDKRQTISGTELAVDWRYASLQKFGQGFLDHFKAITMPHPLLKKINLVDTPAILENRKNLERGYPFNDAFQWFIDRADAIYVVLDPTKVDVGAELGTVVDQLKGRDVRFILNKADTIRRSDLMRVVGQLFWNLSPLMGSSEAPVIYAVSLSSKPFNPTAPARFLTDQENNFLFDLKDVMGKRVENRILYARRHAVRVRNHAKMVDCYLATYYRHKSIFSNKKNVANMITENPMDYHIYDGLGSLSNISRFDLPDVSTYKNFFKLHPLYDFRPLASTCSYFRGCPIDKLDAAISNDLPELLAKYKKAKDSFPSPAKQEGR